MAEPDAAKLAGKLLYDASISCHQLALQKNDSLTYANAIDAYMEYIRNWNLLLDLKIILLTIFGSKKSQNAC